MVLIDTSIIVPIDPKRLPEDPYFRLSKTPWGPVDPATGAPVYHFYVGRAVDWKLNPANLEKHAVTPKHARMIEAGVRNLRDVVDVLVEVNKQPETKVKGAALFISTKGKVLAAPERAYQIAAKWGRLGTRPEPVLIRKAATAAALIAVPVAPR